MKVMESYFMNYEEVCYNSDGTSSLSLGRIMSLEYVVIRWFISWVRESIILN